MVGTAASSGRSLRGKVRLFFDSRGVKFRLSSLQGQALYMANLKGTVLIFNREMVISLDFFLRLIVSSLRTCFNCFCPLSVQEVVEPPINVS